MSFSSPSFPGIREEGALELISFSDLPASPMNQEDFILKRAGSVLRRLRHKRGLTTRDVEAASATLGRKYRNHKYEVPISRLCEFESGGTTPSIYRLYSLALIYSEDLHQLLRLYGIGTDNSELQSPSATPQSTGFATPAVLDVSATLQKAFDSRKTCYLGQHCGRVGEALPLEYLEQFANPNCSYGYIGSEDWTMYPLLPPATLVQIDESRNRVSALGWTSEYERPIYFVEMRGKHVCCWCTANREVIILTPHPLSPVPPKVLQHHDAEVLGQVVGAALPLGRKRSFPSSSTK